MISIAYVRSSPRQRKAEPSALAKFNSKLEIRNCLPINFPDIEIQRPHNRDQIRIGFFSAGDGAEFAIKLDGQRKIYAFPRYELKPVLFEWRDLESMLLSEIDRMAALFRQRKGAVDPLNVLAPPWE